MSVCGRVISEERGEAGSEAESEARIIRGWQSEAEGSPKLRLISEEGKQAGTTHTRGSSILDP